MVSQYAVTEDWFVEAVEQVADTGRQACPAIETAVEALRAGCEARDTGRSIVEVVDELVAAGGRETRLSAAEAFREYERAIASMRADVVRALVDEGGLSLTQVARRLKISRQAAARLYESEREPKAFRLKRDKGLKHLRSGIEGARFDGDVLDRRYAESIPHIVWTASPDGATTYFNQPRHGLHGLPARDQLRVELGHARPSRRRGAGGTGLAPATVTGTDFLADFRIRRYDGAFRWHTCRARAAR